jgi:hypothetical protein
MALTMGQHMHQPHCYCKPASAEGRCSPCTPSSLEAASQHGMHGQQGKGDSCKLVKPTTTVLSLALSCRPLLRVP